jgi:DNA-directed RNA polymerase subunit RPC12/RpoP
MNGHDNMYTPFLHEFVPGATKSIGVKFKCLKCGKDVEEEISVPWPDMESNSIGYEDTVENDSIQCSNCEEDYDYVIFSHGILQIDQLEIEEVEVEVEDFFYDEPSFGLSDKASLLQKWNNRLFVNEPSKRFIELVLKKDSSKDWRTIRREWLNERASSEDSFFMERPSEFTVYNVRASGGGRKLLIYFVKDIDTISFEKDMAFVWDFLENCYDETWWTKEYGHYLKGHPANCLTLEKSKMVIGVH